MPGWPLLLRQLLCVLQKARRRKLQRERSWSTCCLSGAVPLSDPVKVFIIYKRKSLFSEQQKARQYVWGTTASEAQHCNLRSQVQRRGDSWNSRTQAIGAHRLNRRFFAYPTLEYVQTKKTFEAECYVDFLGVPVSGQKMICSGKQLNTGDGWIDKSIKEVSATKVYQTGFDQSRPGLVVLIVSWQC